jgi:hypothetical protein
MNKKDKQKFGLYIFLGFAFGGILGIALGTVNGNIFNGFWIGASIGVSLGWFIAAAIFEKNKKEK